MHAVHGADPAVTGRVLDAWARFPPHGWVGRGLPALFAEVGMTRPAIVAETMVVADGDRPARPPFRTMAIVAERSGAVTADEAQRWLAQLAEAGRQGRFLWAVTLFAVAGIRP
jgi:hypothetical protein